MSRKVLSENTMYGGLPDFRAMVRRSSRSFWNSDSSSSSGIYEPSASPGTLAESAVSATCSDRNRPPPTCVPTVRSHSGSRERRFRAARAPNMTIGIRPSAIDRYPSVAIWPTRRAREPVHVLSMPKVGIRSGFSHAASCAREPRTSDDLAGTDALPHVMHATVDRLRHAGHVDGLERAFAVRAGTAFAGLRKSPPQCSPPWNQHRATIPDRNTGHIPQAVGGGSSRPYRPAAGAWTGERFPARESIVRSHNRYPVTGRRVTMSDSIPQQRASAARQPRFRAPAS